MATLSKGSDERLRNLEHEIDRMGTMAGEALAKAKVTGFQALEGFISKQDAAREKMRGVGSAGGDAWKELKQGLETAWKELHGAVQSAIKTFQKRQMQENRPAGQASNNNHASAKPPKKKNAKKKSAHRTNKSPVTSVRRRSSKRSS